jgi:hypothetical protein
MVHTIAVENAGFELALVQWGCFATIFQISRSSIIRSSQGLIAPLVTMICRLLLRCVVSRDVLPRERFSRVPGMLNSSEVKVFHPT